MLNLVEKQTRANEPAAQMNEAPLRILCATDLSSRSEPAMNRALDLTHSLNGEAMLLHIVDDQGPIRFVGRTAGHALDALKWHARRRRIARVKPELSVLIGDTVKTIISAAKRWRADLIVIGKHRRRRGDRMRLSTAERIARRTGCPVLVVNTNTTDAYRGLVLADSRRHARLMHLTQRFSMFHAARVAVTPSASLLGQVAYVAGDLAQTLRISGAERLHRFARRKTEQRAIDDGLHAMGFEIARSGDATELMGSMKQARGPQLFVVPIGRIARFDRSGMQSTARLALRQRACDVLFVPSGAETYALVEDELAAEPG